MLAPLALTLLVLIAPLLIAPLLIATPLRAQNAPGLPRTGAGIGGNADVTVDPAVPDQTRKHFVPQHFTPQGVYVPPHYEARKPAPFRGYFADKEAQRQREKQTGYKEPTPNYTTPQDDVGRHVEGR